MLYPQFSVKFAENKPVWSVVYNLIATGYEL